MVIESERCPYCDQPYPREYRRRLTHEMARNLVRIDAAYTTRRHAPIHINTFLLSGGRDESRLVLWDLLAPAGGAKKDGNPRNGYYHVTPRGHAFAQGSVRVRTHVVERRGELLHYDGDLVNITEAIGDFDYNELIGRDLPVSLSEEVTSG